MSFHKFRCLCVALAFSIASASAADNVEERAVYIGDSTIYDGRLLCLFADGTVSAWTLDGAVDKSYSEPLNAKKVLHLAADDKNLWALDNNELYRRQSNTGSWNSAARLSASDSQKLVVASGEPLVLHSASVEAPLKRRNYSLPNVQKGRVFLVFHPLAQFADQQTLWIGTGQGEWGGHLLGLNVQSGKWAHFYDALHYVSGITSDNAGTLYVSWSMSHMLADTLIRTHAADGSPSHDFPELSDRYYQRIAFSTFDNQLYGIEQNQLVTIAEGKPTILAKLGKIGYEPENHAVGVAPSVEGLYPIGKNRVVIVHRLALPYVYDNGQLSQLTR